MKDHGFAPRSVHGFDFFKPVSLLGKKRFDGVVDDGGESDYIAQRNMGRRRRFIGLVLFQVSMAQANFVLIVKPILIIGAAANIENPLLETFFALAL